MLPPTFTIFTPDIFACIYIVGFQTARLLREVLLEQEVHVVGEDAQLLIENAETRRLLAYVLVRMNRSEEVDDELHGLTS